MTKKKKAIPNKEKTAIRSPLAAIEAELDTVLRGETPNIVRSGRLLTEAKTLQRGKWLPWLKERYSMSERSAQRRMKAYEFAKSVTVTDFSKCDLSPSALYLLSEDRYWKGIDDKSRRVATEAVLKEASEKPVGEDRAKEIVDRVLDEVAAAENAEYEAFRTKQEADRAKRLDWEAKNPERAKEKARKQAIRDAMRDEMDEAKQQTRSNGDSWGEVRDDWIEQWHAENWGEQDEADFEADWKDRWARDHGPAGQAESARGAEDAPLPKPQPEPEEGSEPEAEPENEPEREPRRPPPPAPLPRDKYLAEKFETAIREIKELTTKPSAKFVGVIPADDLEMIANFLRQIAAGTKARAA
jgi:hypothetical protein